MQHWWYAKQKERRGPVTIEQLWQLIAAGEVIATDPVWTQGMPQWRMMRDVPELSPRRIVAPAPTMAMPLSPTVVRQNPESAMVAPIGDNAAVIAHFPPRAARNLLGHAAPAGDLTCWPVDDVLFAEFKNAVQLQHRIRSAARLYRALALFCSIIVISVLIAGLVMLTTSPRKPEVASIVGLSVGVLFMIAFTVLYWVCYRFTLRSHRWAPLTFIIFWIAMTALQLLGMLGTAMSQERAEMIPVLISFLITLLCGFLFIGISWRAFAAIPKYLTQPAWCQELIAVAG